MKYHIKMILKSVYSRKLTILELFKMLTTFFKLNRLAKRDMYLCGENVIDAELFLRTYGQYAVDIISLSKYVKKYEPRYTSVTFFQNAIPPSRIGKLSDGEFDHIFYRADGLPFSAGTETPMERALLTVKKSDRITKAEIVHIQPPKRPKVTAHA